MPSSILRISAALALADVQTRRVQLHRSDSMLTQQTWRCRKYQVGALVAIQPAISCRSETPTYEQDGVCYTRRSMCSQRQARAAVGFPSTHFRKCSPAVSRAKDERKGARLQLSDSRRVAVDLLSDFVAPSRVYCSPMLCMAVHLRMLRTRRRRQPWSMPNGSQKRWGMLRRHHSEHR